MSSNDDEKTTKTKKLPKQKKYLYFSDNICNESLFLFS
jgi:hypothetical protein